MRRTLLLLAIGAVCVTMSGAAPSSAIPPSARHSAQPGVAPGPKVVQKKGPEADRKEAAEAVAGEAEEVAKLTGAGSVNATDTKYQVMGTDLGIMWDNGAGQILSAFGDTYGEGWAAMAQVLRRQIGAAMCWRDRVIAISLTA